MWTKQHDNGEQQTNMNHQSKTRNTNFKQTLDGTKKHPKIACQSKLTTT